VITLTKYLPHREHLITSTDPHITVPTYTYNHINKHIYQVYTSQQLWLAGFFCRIRNWLPDSLRDPAISSDSFKHSLKTFLFSAYSCTECIRAFWTMRSTELLTYLLYSA